MATANMAAPAASKAGVVVGRILSVLVVLFLLFDCLTKLFRVPSVMAQAAQTGFHPDQLSAIGATLLVCVILYIVPQTARLGALLLTGYLGGACATNLHLGGSLVLVLFPVVFGVLVWVALQLRDPQVRGFFGAASPL